MKFFLYIFYKFMIHPSLGLHHKLSYHLIFHNAYIPHMNTNASIQKISLFLTSKKAC